MLWSSAIADYLNPPLWSKVSRALCKSEQRLKGQQETPSPHRLILPKIQVRTEQPSTLGPSHIPVHKVALDVPSCPRASCQHPCPSPTTRILPTSRPSDLVLLQPKVNGQAWSLALPLHVGEFSAAK